MSAVEPRLEALALVRAALQGESGVEVWTGAEDKPAVVVALVGLAGSLLRALEDDPLDALDRLVLLHLAEGVT